MKKSLVIAIDGPSGAGKSTAAKLLASNLGYRYLDSGRLYRAMGWVVLQEGIDPGDPEALKNLCQKVQISLQNANGQFRISIGEKDITDELKTPTLDRVSSLISGVPVVRERLYHLQRQVGSQGGVVIEGRDIGSVVFPDADVKFYLDASVETRAKRRYEELKQSRHAVTLKSVEEELRSRDRRDMQRSVAPLKKAGDAISIDTTDLTLGQVVDTMKGEILKKLKN